MTALKHHDVSTVLAEVRKLARRLHRREQAVDQARNDLEDMIRAVLATADAGISTRQLAKAANVSQPRIVQIGQHR